MIEIKVHDNGRKTLVNCNVHIEGRDKAVHEFYAIIKSLSDLDESVLCDAMERHVCGRLDEILGGDDDDSES